MSGKKIGIEQFSKPVKFQPIKTNDTREDEIEKIPQSKTWEVNYSKPYHSRKDFRSSKIVCGNQKRYCKHEWLKIYPCFGYDVTSDSVTCYLLEHKNPLGNLKPEQS